MNQALPLLLQTIEAARDQQAARSALARQSVAQAEATLARLRQFRDECLARSAGGSLAMTHAAALQDHQRFLARLDEAILLQDKEVRRHTLQAEQQQLVLQLCQRRLLALQALRDRYARAALARASRQEQRDADEFAARAGARQALQAGA